ncbi:two-component system, OmpR family, sensor histidine kinase CpxA [Solimonas aquatica]|uniref:histidine kinase n=1 Tax=Solimonas aquatica TaxID=489703 RepID=A0A1H9JWU2_9GAMM|nr:ATP-binding protein [Solimonas aquatica]SEQ91015.1 two-component system, OmpR family, sensor histidine kinase CpxA [Solimonas aquatica]
MRLRARLTLFFSLAIVATVLISFAIGAQLWRLRQNEYDGREEAQLALQQLQLGDEALEHWLRHMRRNDGIWRMLLDERGLPVVERGLTPPPRLREALAAVSESRSGVLLPGGGILRSTTVIAEDGRRYRWIAVLPPPRGDDMRRMDTLLLISIGIAVMSILAWYLARRLTQPIGALREASRAVAKGQLTARIPAGVVARRDEIGELAQDFNLMAEHLQRLIEAQRQLLRDVSHELRSPLARLQIATELARDTHQAQHFDRIEQETARLDELIGQLILLARLEHQNTAASEEQLALDELLESICEDARFEAAARHIEVLSELSPGLQVKAQANLLHSAIENVLRNALRHAPEHSRVSLRLRSERQCALIDIEDQGPGIPEDQLEAVFEPFVRVSRARERESGGYGLGLAISKRVIEALHGRILAQNRREGGLRVRIELPLA